MWYLIWYCFFFPIVVSVSQFLNYISSFHIVLSSICSPCLLFKSFKSHWGQHLIGWATTACRSFIFPAFHVMRESWMQMSCAAWMAAQPFILSQTERRMLVLSHSAESREDKQCRHNGSDIFSIPIFQRGWLWLCYYRSKMLSRTWAALLWLGTMAASTSPE